MTVVLRRNRQTQNDHHLPSPFLNHRAQHLLFSVRDGLVLTLIRNLFSSSTPHNVLFLEYPLLHKLMSVCGDEGNIRLSDLDEENPIILRTKQSLYEGVQKIAEQARGILVRAHVNTALELEAKKKILSQLKREALDVYMRQDGLKNKKKIDYALAQLRCGYLGELDKESLDQYWEVVAADPYGGQNHRFLEEKLYWDFQAFSMEAFGHFKRWLPPFFSPYSEILKTVLWDSYDKVVSEWEKARRRHRDKNGITCCQYMTHKGNILAAPFIQRCLRRYLTPLLSNLPSHILELANKKAFSNQSTLIYAHKSLLSPECCTDRDKVKLSIQNAVLEAAEDYIEITLTGNRTCKALRLQQIRKLENFDCLEWAKSQFCFSHEGIQKILNEETHRERTVSQYLNLIAPDDPEKEMEEDLSLDLASISDPVDFFVARLRSRDEQAFVLLSP